MTICGFCSASSAVVSTVLAISSTKELALGTLVLWLLAIFGEVPSFSTVETPRLSPSLSSIYGDFSVGPFRPLQGLSIKKLKGFNLFSNCSDSHEHQFHSRTPFVPPEDSFNDLFGDVLLQ